MSHVRFDHAYASARNLQKLPTMASANVKIRILLVRPWTEPLAPLRAELRSGGFDAQLVRIDFEPALNAALARERFDAVIFDPATPGLSRELIETRLREHRRAAPVVVLESVSTIAGALARALAELRN
jgi:DNA-binding response OmpR family regulator